MAYRIPLALLVTSAENRDDVLGEIVRGARRLLRADACAVFVGESDGGLLSRTLANLLSNAAKFSGPGEPVSVWAVEEGPWMRIGITDRGVGLTPDEATRAFEPFWRTRGAKARAMRGAGIGLALVQEYVRFMGGRVGADSEPGRGSTFWFTLKRASAPTDGSHRASHPRAVGVAADEDEDGQASTGPASAPGVLED